MNQADFDLGQKVNLLPYTFQTKEYIQCIGLTELTNKLSFDKSKIKTKDKQKLTGILEYNTNVLHWLLGRNYDYHVS